MAETRTSVTREQKIEMARKALADANRGEYSPAGFTENVVFHGAAMGDVRGRDAVLAALKGQRDAFQEFTQEPHAILADDEHVVALINLKVKDRGEESQSQMILVVHTTDQGQINEMWSMMDADAVDRLRAR
jgi:hypothetical protein